MATPRPSARPWKVVPRRFLQNPLISASFAARSTRALNGLHSQKDPCAGEGIASPSGHVATGPSIGPFEPIRCCRPEPGDSMRRREFICLLGGAVAAWPLASRAQQNSRSTKIGYLGPSSLTLERAQVDALRQRLHELGHVEGKDIAYVFRWAEGHDARLPSLAAELVNLKPDVIVTTGTPGTLAAKRATSTIPIVFASSANPVSTGLVATYSRPGGNVTGFTIFGPELEGKRVQLIKEMVSGVSQIAIMWNPSNPGIVDFLFQTRAAASALNLAVKPVAEVVDAEGLKDARCGCSTPSDGRDRGSFPACAPHRNRGFRSSPASTDNVPIPGLRRRRRARFLRAR